eukprot:317424_1
MEQLDLFKSLSNDLTLSEYSEFLDTLLNNTSKQLFSALILHYFDSKSNDNNSVSRNVTIKQINDIMQDIIEDRNDCDESSDNSSESQTDSDENSNEDLSNTNDAINTNEIEESKIDSNKVKKKSPPQLLLSNNPCIKYGTKRDKRPFIWIYIHRTDAKSSRGFVKRKYLVDSGAKRSSIYEEDARKLKLLPRGTVKVLNASKGIERSLVRVRISTGNGNGNNCWKSVTSAIDITCNVRHKSSNIKRGILGADWLSVVKPTWPI